MINRNKQKHGRFYKRSGIYILSILSLFIAIGVLTTLKPAYRLSSQAISSWTSDIDASTFAHVIGLENRAFNHLLPEDESMPNIPETLLQMAVQLKPNDPRSFLGTEIPGFSIFDQEILIAGEGTDYTNLPVESSPPLEDVLKEREAVDGQDDVEKEKQDPEAPETSDDVVFLYNTHNRESFLPHLPDVDDPNQAFHEDVNVTKVSQHLAEALESHGIGTAVDKTDIAQLLNDKDWGHEKSYDASRDVVKDVLGQNEEITYAFDLHRDAIGHDATTKEIDGKDYARIMIVVGEEYDSHEKNLKFASDLHYLLDEKYPGLSRGVLPKKGTGTNGVFNQDLSENAILFEFGGVDNTLEELYRSADALAEVFSEYYWDAEKVDAESEGEKE